MVQDRLLDPPQAADFLTHLNLGMTVSFEDRPGQVAEEVVRTVAVGHCREFRRDPGHEGILLVRDPEGHRLAQILGPSLRLGDQPPDLVGRRREQRLGEPDPLGGQLADDVERLVSLLGLQAVDREDEGIGLVIEPPRRLEVLLACREHRLVAVDVVGDPGHREVDGEAVVQIRTDLGDRRVTRESPMPDPAEDVPGDAPAGQGEGRFDLGALGPGMPRTARVGAAIQLGDEMDGAVESEEVAMSMIADRHQVPADRAAPVDDIEFQEGEIRVLGPVMWHGVDFRVVGDSLPVVLQVGKEDT